MKRFKFVFLVVISMDSSMFGISQQSGGMFDNSGQIGAMDNMQPQSDGVFDISQLLVSDPQQPQIPYQQGNMMQPQVPYQQGYMMQSQGYVTQQPYMQGQMYSYPSDLYQMMGCSARLSKGQLISMLQNYIIQVTGGKCQISKVEKIEETPQVLRHACSQAKVSFLACCNFPVQELGIHIPFYFCKACGKLYYYNDFM